MIESAKSSSSISRSMISVLEFAVSPIFAFWGSLRIVVFAFWASLRIVFVCIASVLPRASNRSFVFGLEGDVVKEMSKMREMK